MILDLERLIFASERPLLVISPGAYHRLSRDQSRGKLRFLMEKKMQIFDQFSINPKFTEVGKGADFAKKIQPDLIIALGGGTTLDVAKLISVLACLPADDGYAAVLKEEQVITKKFCPVIAIPTTFGSGAEATHFAVAYQGQVKHSIASQYILPDHVFLLPNLTLSMPPSVAAVAAMDALCQSIESYWSPFASQQSEAFALQALSFCKEYLYPAVKEPTLENHYNMLQAAHLAGKAIDITKTSAPHAFSYHLTTVHEIPHGEAVGIMMNYILKYHEIYAGDSLRKKIKKIEETLDISKEKGLREWLTGLQIRLGLKHELPEQEKKAKALIEAVNVERLKNHPLEIDMDKFSEILSSK